MKKTIFAAILLFFFTVKNRADTNMSTVAVSATGLDKSVLNTSLYTSKKMEIANPVSKNMTKMVLLYLSSKRYSSVKCGLSEYFLNQLNITRFGFFRMKQNLNVKIR